MNSRKDAVNKMVAWIEQHIASQMNSKEDAVNKMVAWIEQHIAEPATYLDMARQIGYSPAYCSTVFHRYTGLTLREYAMQRRLYRAAVDRYRAGLRLFIP